MTSSVRTSGDPSCSAQASPSLPNPTPSSTRSGGTVYRSPASATASASVARSTGVPASSKGSTRPR